MDWSTNLNNLFNNYKTNNKKDLNFDGKIDSKDTQKLFEQSNIFKMSEISYEDLITLSTKKDLNNDNDISEDESSFFNDLKNFLYEKIAQNINKNKDLSLDDMMELENTLRDLSDTQKADIGKEMERVQNRMVSNITSQYFLTRETQEFRAAVKENALEIWDMQEKLSEMNETENNPFNAKFENLLDKLDRKIEKTLSETYTAAQIKELRETGKISDITDPEDDIDLPDDTATEDSFEVDGHIYQWKNASDNKQYLYKDGEIFTGFVEYNRQNTLFVNGQIHTGMYEELYYESGFVHSGVGKNGNYYVDGKAATGDFTSISATTLHVENGKILSEDKMENGNIVRTIFIEYEHYNSNDRKIESTYSKIITFDGSNTNIIKYAENYENGRKISTDNYSYNIEDDTYTVVTHYVDSAKEDETKKYDKAGVEFTDEGFCYFNGKLYEDGIIAKGEKDWEGKKYFDGNIIDGLYKGCLYSDGVKFTGINEVDKLYYKDGEIKPSVFDNDNNLYINGVLAQGIYNINGSIKYYEQGKVVNIKQSIINFVNNKIENAIIKTENGITTITGQCLLNGEMSPVQYNITKFNSNDEIEEFSQVRKLKKIEEVSQTDTFKINNGNTELTGSVLTLKGATEDLTIDLPIDNAKDENTIDYSITFSDADGKVTGGVFVATAINDRVSEVVAYNKDENGNYKEGDSIIAFATINEIQSGRSYDSFSKNEITENDDNTYTYNYADESESYEVSLNYDKQTGNFVSGTIKFVSSFEEIELGPNDMFKFEDGKVTIIDKTNNSITVYRKDGNIENRVLINETITDFAEKLGLSIFDITAFETDSQDNVISVTIAGIEYNVTYDNQKLTLSSEDYEMIFENISDNDETFNYILTYKKEKDDNGNLVSKTWNTNGVLVSYEIKKSGENFTTKAEYENGKPTKITVTYDDGSRLIEKYYGENNQITKSIETKINGDIETVTTYIGNLARKTAEIETNKVNGDFTTTTFDSDGNATLTEVKTEDGTLTQRKIYSYSSAGRLLNILICDIDSDGNIEYPVKILNANGSYAIQNEDGTIEGYYDKNNLKLIDEYINIANDLGLLIEEVILNTDGTINSLVGQTHDYKQTVYTNLTEETDGTYSYTETLTLSNNATTDVDDDIVLVTVVENNEQKSEKIIVDGNAYDINVNGAKTNDKKDNDITTIEANDMALKINVHDVLIDEITRQRNFNKVDDGYAITEILSLASIEDVKSNNANYFSFEGGKISQDGDGIYVLPDNNGKIVIYYGKYTQKDDTHNVGDNKKAYEISLDNDSYLIITKTDTGYVIKDSNNKTYNLRETAYTMT